MNLEKLLELFSAFDRDNVDYAVTGDLADLMRGRIALSEGIGIAVVDLDRARRSIVEAWPESLIKDSTSALRILPPNTPFYVDVLAQAVAAVETVLIRGVLVRVASRSDRFVVCDTWSRSGFTLRDRLAALHALTRELVPPHQLSGVRKYRSVEQANAERERWDTERAERLRAERLRK